MITGCKKRHVSGTASIERHERKMSGTVQWLNGSVRSEENTDIIDGGCDLAGMNLTKSDLENEKKELDQRLEALKTSANEHGQFQSVGSEQQGLLFQQRDAMQRYSDALGERIRTWSDSTAAGLADEPQKDTFAAEQKPRTGKEPADPDDGIREAAKGESHKDARKHR